MIRWLEWVVKTFGNLESYRDSAPSLRVREMILSLLICLQCPKVASSSNLCNHDLFVALSGIYVPAGWIPQIAKTSQTRWQIGLSWVECPAIWVVAPRPTTTWTCTCSYNANGQQCSKKQLQTSSCWDKNISYARVLWVCVISTSPRAHCRCCRQTFTFSILVCAQLGSAVVCAVVCAV